MTIGIGSFSLLFVIPAVVFATVAIIAIGLVSLFRNDTHMTTWQGRPALTQGRIYAVFQNKQPQFEKSYDLVIRYIRRHWRKNPAAWMGGYLGPAASEWFDRGWLLLPNYIPPLRRDWIERLAEQHPQ